MRTKWLKAVVMNKSNNNKNLELFYCKFAPQMLIKCGDDVVG